MRYLVKSGIALFIGQVNGSGDARRLGLVLISENQWFNGVF